MADYNPIQSMLFHPNSKPFGLTYSQWTVKWWQWLLSIPIPKNPALDMTGMHVSENQFDSNVWFLAGTFGGSAVRSCKIPLGKAILLPVINYQCSFADDPTVTTEAELRLRCGKEIEDIKNLSFGINELFLEDLPRYRTRSPLFDVSLVEDNVLGVGICNTKMVSDGYWILVKPLPIGQHLLISAGSCRSGKIMIGATFHLYVH